MILTVDRLARLDKFLTELTQATHRHNIVLAADRTQRAGSDGQPLDAAELALYASHQTDNSPSHRVATVVYDAYDSPYALDVDDDATDDERDRAAMWYSRLADATEAHRLTVGPAVDIETGSPAVDLWYADSDLCPRHPAGWLYYGDLEEGYVLDTDYPESE